MSTQARRSVFERYNIVSEGDLTAAARRLEEATGMVSGIVRPAAVGDAMPMSEVLRKKLEAPPGFEPGMEVLQTSALPLGDGALLDERTSAGTAACVLRQD